MEKDDFIKKLEEASLPEIEIASHKRRLKTVLLAKYFPEKKKAAVFNIFRKLAPVGAIAVLVLVLNTLISSQSVFSPQYTLADARNIALKDPKIKELIEEGVEIKDVEIIDNKGYILFQKPQTPTILGVTGEPMPTSFSKESFSSNKALSSEKEMATGMLVEVDLKKKSVLKVDRLDSEKFLPNPSEQVRVKAVVKKSLEKQTVIPQGAEILETKISPPPATLIKINKSVEVIPEESQEARVIYEYENKKWESTIDLRTGQMEAPLFLEESRTPETQK